MPAYEFVTMLCWFLFGVCCSVFLVDASTYKCEVQREGLCGLERIYAKRNVGLGVEARRALARAVAVSRWAEHGRAFIVHGRLSCMMPYGLAESRIVPSASTEQNCMFITHLSGSARVATRSAID